MDNYCNFEQNYQCNFFQNNIERNNLIEKKLLQIKKTKKSPAFTNAEIETEFEEKIYFIDSSSTRTNNDELDNDADLKLVVEIKKLPNYDYSCGINDDVQRVLAKYLKMPTKEVFNAIKYLIKQKIPNDFISSMARAIGEHNDHSQDYKKYSLEILSDLLTNEDPVISDAALISIMEGNFTDPQIVNILKLSAQKTKWPYLKTEMTLAADEIEKKRRQEWPTI